MKMFGHFYSQHFIGGVKRKGSATGHNTKASRLDEQNSNKEIWNYMYTHNVEAAEQLLASKVDVNKVEDWKEKDFSMSLLEYAVSFSDNHMVQMLLRMKANPNNKRVANGALPNASKLKFLLDAKADVNQNIATFSGRGPDYITMLHRATENNYVNSMQVLINAKANLNEEAGSDLYDFTIGITPLYIAVKNHSHNAFQVLLDAKADINLMDDDEYGLLDFTLGKNDVEATRMLVNAKINLEYENGDGDTALLSAASNKHIKPQIINMLVSAKANIDAESEDHFKTPLYLTAENNNNVAFQLLLDAKADVNHISADHKTLLTRAISASPSFYNKNNNKNTNIARMLLDAKASFDRHATMTNKTALHEAAYHGRTQMVNLLIDVKANINEQIRDDGDDDGDEGHTPLHIAARFNRNNVIKLLLQRKADIYIKDNLNRTALDVARQQNDQVGATLLHNERVKKRRNAMTYLERLREQQYTRNYHNQLKLYKDTNAHIASMFGGAKK